MAFPGRAPALASLTAACLAGALLCLPSRLIHAAPPGAQGSPPVVDLLPSAADRGPAQAALSKLAGRPVVLKAADPLLLESLRWAMPVPARAGCEEQTLSMLAEIAQRQLVKAPPTPEGLIPALLEQAYAQLKQKDGQAALESIQSTYRVLPCATAILTRDQARALFRDEAVAHLYLNDGQDARAFADMIAVDPDQDIEPRFPQEVKVAYSGAADAQREVSAVKVTAGTEIGEIFVDGQTAATLGEVRPGRHVVQWRALKGELRTVVARLAGSGPIQLSTLPELGFPSYPQTRDLLTRGVAAGYLSRSQVQGLERFLSMRGRPGVSFAYMVSGQASPLMRTYLAGKGLFSPGTGAVTPSAAVAVVDPGSSPFELQATSQPAEAASQPAEANRAASETVPREPASAPPAASATVARAGGEAQTGANAAVRSSSSTATDAVSQPPPGPAAAPSRVKAPARIASRARANGHDLSTDYPWAREYLISPWKTVPPTPVGYPPPPPEYRNPPSEIIPAPPAELVDMTYFPAAEVVVASSDTAASGNAVSQSALVEPKKVRPSRRERALHGNGIGVGVGYLYLLGYEGASPLETRTDGSTYTPIEAYRPVFRGTPVLELNATHTGRGGAGPIGIQARVRLLPGQPQLSFLAPAQLELTATQPPSYYSAALAMHLGLRSGLQFSVGAQGCYLAYARYLATVGFPVPGAEVVKTVVQLPTVGGGVELTAGWSAALGNSGLQVGLQLEGSYGLLIPYPGKETGTVSLSGYGDVNYTIDQEKLWGPQVSAVLFLRLPGF